MQMIGSLMLAAIVGTALIMGLFVLEDYIDPPEKPAPGTMWMAMVPEPNR
jgi:hypothetical protein